MANSLQISSQEKGDFNVYIRDASLMDVRNVPPSALHVLRRAGMQHTARSAADVRCPSTGDRAIFCSPWFTPKWGSPEHLKIFLSTHLLQSRTVIKSNNRTAHPKTRNRPWICGLSRILPDPSRIRGLPPTP